MKSICLPLVGAGLVFVALLGSDAALAKTKHRPHHRAPAAAKAAAPAAKPAPPPAPVVTPASTTPAAGAPARRPGGFGGFFGVPYPFDQSYRRYIERIARHLASVELDAEEVIDSVYVELYGTRIGISRV